MTLQCGCEQDGSFSCETHNHWPCHDDFGCPEDFGENVIALCPPCREKRRKEAEKFA